MTVSFNRTSKDQVHQVSVSGAVNVDYVHVPVTNNIPDPVLEVGLVNQGTGPVFFRLDGSTASATDRVLLAGERLVINRDAQRVSLFAAAAEPVEVCFST